MKLTKYSQLKHGMRVKCEINGTKIDDARLSIDDYGKVFICQNLKDGQSVDNRLGYRYSWKFSFKNENIANWISGITNLESIEDSGSMRVGDIVIDNEGFERKVLEVLPNMFAYSYILDSYINNVEGFANWITFSKAKKSGWKLKDQEGSEKQETFLTEEDWELLRDSKQEISMGTSLTSDNLEKFIHSNVAGLTVGKLVTHFLETVKKLKNK